MDEVDCIICELERILEPVLKPIKKSVKDLIWEAIHNAFDDVVDVLTREEEEDEMILDQPPTLQPVGTPFPSAKDVLYDA